ncbi:hypothetical protein ADIAL_1320 [Alkalibacterium sp. AK22]|uniref:hypothetical protein n=1 Tax=Alkalibacterium sp. AK22 TaxID=1229520 RepID=UPI00045234A6|nr:hypothetical protein [Alkalibacterium sp. AK22]EXJ23173.1 hypothetical protein ADIAL_1320 [Alkalibacterium sp. AK22]
MKIMLIAYAVVASLALTACGTNDEAELENGGELEDTEQPAEEEVTDDQGDIDTQEDEAALDNEPDEDMVTDEELALASEAELEEAEPIEDLSQYEEFAEQDVFSPDNYDAYLLSDEGGMREILFMDNSQQLFRSIYTYEDNNLRIIDLINQELLLNSPL